MKKIITSLIAAAMLCVNTAAYAYSDVSENDWYYGNISEMSERGLLTGYEDGSFRPSGQITYAEFITVIKRCAAPGSVKAEGGHWAKRNIAYAYEHGWYDYDEINEAVYDAPIPRYMAVKLAALAFDIPKTENDDGVYWRYMNEIRDFNSINGRYAYLAVRAYNNGIVTGDENGCFNPDSALTRAEACAVISRALKLTGAPAQSVSGADTPQTAQPPQSDEYEKPAVKGAVSENGALRVKGTQLCNSRGEAVVLRGMSSHGLQWFPRFTSRSYIHMSAQSGANLFRAAMYTADGGYIDNPDMMKERLYTAVDNASAEDMYAIIDWHILSDGNPMTYVNEAAAFFDEASRKYARSDNVIYEICNEPNGNISWSGDVKPYAERIVPVIRANDPDSVILVGSPVWSQEIDKAADDPLLFDNIMYTCHFYAGTHTQWLRDKITYALSKGAPVFVSEWGTSAADGNGGVFADETRKWLDFMRENKISWANWSMCDKSESSASFSGSGLSESGRIVFNAFDD